MRLPFVSRWRYETVVRECELHVVRQNEQRTANLTVVADLQAVHEARIADLRERLVESKAVTADLQKKLDDANSRHFIATATLQDQHHELAMHPPTGILTGPMITSPLDAFGEKAREAINAMSSGLPQSSRDAMITAALRYKATNPLATDEDIAKVVVKGESRG